jgi:hypothetical protein
MTTTLALAGNPNESRTDRFITILGGQALGLGLA